MDPVQGHVEFEDIHVLLCFAQMWPDVLTRIKDRDNRVSSTDSFLGDLFAAGNLESNHMLSLTSDHIVRAIDTTVSRACHCTRTTHA